MIEQIKDHLAAAPQRVLVDTHYATHEDIVSLADQDIAVYAPVPADKSEV